MENERMTEKLEKRADIEATYNKATKQHGFKGMARCSKCLKPYLLETTDPEIFNTGTCF